MRIAPAVVIAATISVPALAAPDWSKVDQAIGRSAPTMPGDVHRYGFPRSDLHVTVDGVTLLPAFALGGWLAFKAEGDGAMEGSSCPSAGRGEKKCILAVMESATTTSWRLNPSIAALAVISCPFVLGSNRPATVNRLPECNNSPRFIRYASLRVNR